MLRSSFSKAGIALTLLAALNMGAMELPTKQELVDAGIKGYKEAAAAAQVAKSQTLFGKAGSALRSFGAGIASGVKSAGKSIYAAPQAVCSFCAKNPKKVGFAAAVVAALGAAGYYLYAKGFFSKPAHKTVKTK